MSSHVNTPNMQGTPENHWRPEFQFHISRKLLKAQQSKLWTMFTNKACTATLQPFR